MSEFKVGVVGTGFAASSHTEALRRLPGVEVTGVAGSSADKARSFAVAHGIADGYGDWRELISQSSLDVIHNCTPNYLHAEVNAAALEAGVNVVSEKPLAMNSDETASLMAAASAAGVLSAVTFNYRHYPLVRQAKAMLDASERRHHFVHGSYLQDWLLYYSDWSWRLDPAAAGRSRAVADIGSHWLDLVQYITSDPILEVCSDLHTVHERRLRPHETGPTFTAAGAPSGVAVEIDTEDIGSVLLHFVSGARGVFSVSQVSPGRKNRLFFETDTLAWALAWDQENPNSLWIGRRDGPNQQLMRDPSLLDAAAAKLAHFPAGHEEGWPDGLKNFCLDFYGALRAQSNVEVYEPSFATFGDAHDTMLIVEAILASHRSGRWVEVGKGKGG